ncbi:MAG: alpha/beta fold hydrolase [Cyanobacterium sp. T60_A2020_053]|nr:alpha/beta fold hydrolase [Cyanobacterium sp. T60_A2020_053]
MNPLVLVHGIIDSSHVFEEMSDYFQNQGYEVYSLDLLPNYGIEDLRVLAQQLKIYIDQNFSSTPKINLIGFSMGGLITRYYLQRLGGLKKVEKYISISAPNNGTKMAHILPLKGITQMRPDSDFLKDLNSDVKAQFSKLKTLILWTPFDLMIIPANSSCLGFCQEKEVDVLYHKWMLSDQRVFKEIKNFLG